MFLSSKHRIKREKHTIKAMMRIYCRQKHGQAEMCADCRELLDYAFRRLDRCKFGSAKPVCGRCPIHCYQPGKRERMIEVMRFAGPRMTYKHPLLALGHLADKFRKTPQK